VRTRPPRPTRPPAPAARASGDDPAVDALYGLEPVIEPGAGSELGAYVAIDCPYCGEAYGTALDFTAGSFTYVEDCQVCCQPIELTVELGDSGTLESVSARRLD
jgi:hypothetical protein